MQELLLVYYYINYKAANAIFDQLISFSKQPFSKTGQKSQCASAWTTLQLLSKGGTRSPQLVNLTLELWEWCLQKSILRFKRDLQFQEMANRPVSDSALPKKVQC